MSFRMHFSHSKWSARPLQAGQASQVKNELGNISWCSNFTFSLLLLIFLSLATVALLQSIGAQISFDLEDRHWPKEITRNSPRPGNLFIKLVGMYTIYEIASSVVARVCMPVCTKRQNLNCTNIKGSSFKKDTIGLIHFGLWKAHIPCGNRRTKRKSSEKSLSIY